MLRMGAAAAVSREAVSPRRRAAWWHPAGGAALQPPQRAAPPSATVARRRRPPPVEQRGACWSRTCRGSSWPGTPADAARGRCSAPLRGGLCLALRTAVRDRWRGRRTRRQCAASAAPRALHRGRARMCRCTSSPGGGRRRAAALRRWPELLWRMLPCGSAAAPRATLGRRTAPPACPAHAACRRTPPPSPPPYSPRAGWQRPPPACPP
mmetsp:Transcript_31477/g.78874  ORF Transcript_31477/g.78874 Transcript_31477/m.78874 type:complete len:209 (-) Transcript_31477:51-677(-)